MKKLSTIATIGLFIYLFLDSFFYPSFTQNKFAITSLSLLLIYICIILYFGYKKYDIFYTWFLSLNKKILFPVLSILYFIFMAFEINNYPNYIFSHIHIHPITFLYLPILSGLIIYCFYPKFKSKNTRLFYFLIPSTLLIFHLINQYANSIFLYISKEDSILENLQFLLFLMAAIYSIKISVYFKNKKLIYFLGFLILSLGLFFIAGEEISWGQRILNFKTPNFIKSINTQDETTLHNIKPFQLHFINYFYILVGVYGCFSRVIIKKTSPKLYKNIFFLTPPLFTFFCFLAPIIFYGAYDYPYYEHLTIGKYNNIFINQELAETYLSLGFFAYLLYYYQNLRPHRNIAKIK